MNRDPPPSGMQEASRLLQAGELRAAQTALETIARVHPDYAEAHRLLAGIRLTLGDATGAERILREAARLTPVWPPVLTMLGELLLGSGRAQEAEEVLARAASGPAVDPRAVLVLARHYNDQQRPAEALALVAPFCAAGKVTADLAAQHVAALVALDRGGDAVDFYRRLARATPANLAARQALAIALQGAGRNAEAGRIAADLLSRGQRSAPLYRAQARSLMALGDYGRAETALRAALQLAPASVNVHDDLARLVWMRTGDAAQATATLDQALRRFAGSDALWAAKAAILQGAGDPHGAYACLADRAARSGAPPTLLVRAGLAALEFDPALACGLALRALAVLPDDGPARKLLAASRLGVGDAAAALPLCEALRAAEPDDQYLIALQTTAWRMLDDARYAAWCDYPTWAVPYRLDAPPGWNSIGDFLADLQRHLGALHDALRHRLLFQSLRHGTETVGDLARTTDPMVQALFKAFDVPIRDYMGRLRCGPRPLRRRAYTAYRFNGAWSVRLHAAGFHRNHVHPRGWISSACYIALPPSVSRTRCREGVLTFGEPGLLTAPALCAQYDILPEPGMLVLFPSYFWHGTVPFAGHGARLTVAFDAIPA